MEKKDFLEVLAKRVFALMMLLITFSCGSKKKLMAKSQFTNQIATVERVKATEKKDINTEVFVSETSKENTKQESDNFQGEVADPSLPATITEEERDGKKIKTYTNFKNVNTGKNVSESEKYTKTALDLSETDKSATAKDSDTRLKATADGSEKNVSKEKPWKFPWWILLVLIIMYGVISYFRGMNPLNWIKR